MLATMFNSQVRQALESAAAHPDEASLSPGKINHARSQRFVANLATQFAVRMEANERIRVLARSRATNRAEFGLNELLHDILVCEVENLPGSQYVRITKAHWQIESEFSRSAFEAVRDFNKLVLGSAENKLFVGTATSRPQARLSLLAPIAAACTGNVFAALLPHPSNWHLPKERATASFWAYRSGKWNAAEATVGLGLPTAL